MTKSLKIALNFACPVGTVDKPHAIIKADLEEAWDIHLDELPKSTVCRVRKALGIEIAGGVNPTWSRPANGGSMRLLITETDMPSPQVGRFNEWLDVLKIVTRTGQDFFDVSCLMSDDEEIFLLWASGLEDEYE